MQKSILVTGAAGFIGSNFVEYFAKKYPNYLIVNIDKLTYAGNLNNLKGCENLKNHIFVKGDICDCTLINDIFEKYNITDIIHFAAESHVDNSIKSPQAFIDTNIIGTFTLLECARKYWKDSTNRFHNISTDEVYGSLGDTGFFVEDSPYCPNSPYSASKASADFLVRAYNKTYGLNVTTSNSSNNYGKNQHSEKFIPKIIDNCINEIAIPIYGDGLNVRDWLYVNDHCRAIDLIFHNAKSGQTYNVGDNNEYTNIDIANKICSIFDKLRPRKNGEKYSNLIEFVEDRLGHDRRYAIDSHKIRTQLSWCAQENIDTGLLKTISEVIGSSVKF